MKSWKSSEDAERSADMAPLRISGYGICLILGAALGGVLCIAGQKSMQHRDRVSDVDLLCCFFLSLIGMGIGAKLLYISLHPQILLIRQFRDALKLVLTGFSFYGAVFGGIAATRIACHGFHLPFPEVMQRLTISYPAIYTIAKIGCGIRGCCFGIRYNGPFAVQAPSGMTRFPAPYAEAMISALITLSLWSVSRKNPSAALKSFLLLHALERFFFEFLRAAETKSMLGVLSVTQLISIAIILKSICNKISVRKQKIRTQL